MNDLIQDLAGVIVDTHEHTGETQPKYAYLGYGPNPDDPVAVDGSPQPREVWYWRDTIEGRETGTAILRSGNGITLDEIAGYKNIRVKIGKPAGEKTEHVLWIDSHEGYNALSGRTPDEQKTNAAGFPSSDRIITLRAVPTSSMYVQVQGPWPYINPSTGAMGYYQDASKDFTADIPGAGLHGLALLYFDPVGGALGRVLGSTATATGTLPSRAEFMTSDYTALAIGYYVPVAMIYLYDGQTSIAEADILRAYDPRLIWQNPIPHILPTRVVIAAGAVTVTIADYLVVVNKTVGAATTVNLPPSPATGLTFVVKDGKGDANTNNITLTPSAGSIDGAGTYVMNINRQSVTVIYDGSEWSIN